MAFGHHILPDPGRAHSLLWLGEADVCATMRKARDNDLVHAVILP
jgi:hypothetical protein